MPQESIMMRRLVAVEKRIEEIQPELDVRVRLMGTVIDVAHNSIVIDDGSGKIDISFERDPLVKEGQLVRVITRVLPLIDGFQCRGEAVQTLDGFNIDLYNKAKEIAKR
ncbi:MAG: replication protein RepA [Candidatus Aenigmatarchaeota archaeon]